MAYDTNLIQKFVVHEGSEASDLMPMHIALVNEEGEPYGGDGGEAATVDTLVGATETGKSLMKASNAEAARSAIGAGTSSFSGSYNDLSDKPAIPTAPSAATTTAAGLVKKSSGVSTVSAADAAAAASDTVTKSEFDAVVTLVNSCKAQINDLISKAKSAGQMA